MGVWTRLQSFIFGGALATAAADAFRAVLEPVRQHAWQRNPLRVLDPNSAARLLAQGLVTEEVAKDEASREGYGPERLDALAQLNLHAPEVGQLIQLIRRSEPTDTQITYALRKAQLDPQFDAMVRRLAHTPLAPGEIGTAVHRGIMLGPDLLVASPPTTPGKVPEIPPSTIDPVEQAAWWGMSHEQLRVLVGITGLPLSLGEMLQLLNRGKVTSDDVQRSIAESNVRNEYMDVALELRRRLLTPHEYAEARVRGWINDNAMLAGGALSGMTADDQHLLWELTGRPIPEHQVLLGEARGGVYDGPTDHIPEPFLRALEQGSLRPEWYNLAFAARFSYPSPFVMRSLAEAGELGGADEVRQLLEEIGWKPDLAEKVSRKWAPTGSAADPHVKKAQGQLWTAAHKSYVDGLTDDTDAATDLTAAGVAHDSIASVLTLWQAERAVARRSLTAAQIRKAVGQPGLDQAWALARLQQLGYTLADAQTFLAE